MNQRRRVGIRNPALFLFAKIYVCYMENYFLGGTNYEKEQKEEECQNEAQAA